MLKRTPLYPFLIAIFPILSLASYNIHEIFVSAIFRPLIASLLLGVFVYGLAYLVTRELHRAALLASIVLLFFFAYGHLYDAVEDWTISGVALFRHRTLIPALGLIVLGILYLAWRSRNPSSITYSANMIAVVMLIFPLFTIGSYLTRQSIANREAQKTAVTSSVQLD